MRPSIILFAAAIGLAGACNKSPVAPTVTSQPSHATSYTPLHDNIPATFAGDPGGPLVWLCATKPRVYIDPHDGVKREVEDHYLQYTECPAELID